MTKMANISDVAEVNPRLPVGLSKEKDRDVDFIPMASLSAKGHVETNGSRKLADVIKGYTYFANGDVIVAKITPCMENGKAAFVNDLPHGIAFGSTEFHVLRPGPKVDGRYLFYMIWNPVFRHNAEGNMAGSAGQKRVPAKFFDRFPIPLPPLPEQWRIADILDKADAIRRKRQEAMLSLDELRRSQFNSWFDPWFSSAHTECNFVPVSHFVERFDGGLNVATPDSPSQDTRHFVLKVSAVTWGEYRQDECKPLYSNYEPPPGHFVQTGDLIFSRANTTELVGATAYVFETADNRVLPDKLWRFVWKEGVSLEPLFVWALFNHPQVRYEIGRRATGTSGSMKNISMGKVLDIKVPWPGNDVQKRFASFLEHEREIYKKMEDSLVAANSLFNSLVQRAFKGAL